MRPLRLEPYYSQWCLSGMRICAKLALLCFLLGISLTVSWAQTTKPSKTPVPSILNNPPDDNPQYFPKGIFRDTSDKSAFKDFVARWYSSDLRAMHEPSLFETSSKDTSLPTTLPLRTYTPRIPWLYFYRLRPSASRHRDRSPL